MSNDPSESRSFLSRWSKRKLANSDAPDEVNASEEADESLAQDYAEPSELELGEAVLAPVHVDAHIDVQHTLSTEVEVGGGEAPKPAPVLTDEDMPDVASMDENSDYSGFMSEGVSEELRKIALRKLFSGVGFNIRDGLDDYDDDFRSFAALGDIITSDMKHQMELEEERKKEAEKLAEERKDREDETELDEEQVQAEETQVNEDSEQQPQQDTDPQVDDQTTDDEEPNKSRAE